MPPITVWCIGEEHNDPAALSSILSATKKIVESNVPLVLCHEHPEDDEKMTMEQNQKRMRDCQDLEQIIKDNDFERFQKKTTQSCLPYFDTNNCSFKQELLSIVRDRLNPCEEEEDSLTNFFLDEFMKLYSRRARCNLFTYVNDKNIASINIDICRNERGLLLKKLEKCTDSKGELAAIAEYEDQRIMNMVKNIYHKAILKLASTGGIIICRVGLLHAKRLSATLQYQIDFSKIKIPSNTNLKILTSYVYSELATLNTIEQNELHFKQLSNLVDSRAIIKLYAKMSFSMFFCENNSMDLAVVKPNRIFMTTVDSEINRISGRTFCENFSFSLNPTILKFGVFSTAAVVKLR